jgi:hypothetical protein
MRLVPHIQNKSIDNFFVVLPERNLFSISIPSLITLLPILKVKLTGNRGTVQILTDINANSEQFKELISYINGASFQISNAENVYFPKDWDGGLFSDIHNVRTLVLRNTFNTE